MTNDKAETDFIRRVFPPNHNGEFLEIGPWELPEFVHLRTTGAKNVEFWGDVNISMDPQFAIAVGHALIAAAGDILNGQKK